MAKQIKTHLAPALGAKSAAPGVVYTQTPVSFAGNGGASDSHNQSSDQGGTRREYTVNRARPGSRGTKGVLPH